MPVDAEDLRTAMRSWATGVTVVAAQYENILHGMTVSSFTSVSLEPPLVLISLEIGTRTHRLVEHTNAFGVTILSTEQQEVSNCFASPHTELGDRFEGRAFFTLETGSPFLLGGLAFFDCRVTAVYPAGNHAIIVGEVVALKSVGEEQAHEPLLYFNRGYRELK